MKEPRAARDRKVRPAFLLRLAVSAGLVLLLLLLADWRQVWGRLTRADPAYLVLVLLLATGDRLLMAWKWWLLVRGRAADGLLHLS